MNITDLETDQKSIKNIIELLQPMIKEGANLIGAIDKSILALKFYELEMYLNHAQKMLEIYRQHEKELLTYKDVQRFLKCGRAKVESLVSGGAFKKIQTGGKKSKVLFKRLEIEDYLKKQRDNDFEALQGSKIVNINSVGGC